MLLRTLPQPTIAVAGGSEPRETSAGAGPGDGGRLPAGVLLCLEVSPVDLHEKDVIR